MDSAKQLIEVFSKQNQEISQLEESLAQLALKLDERNQWEDVTDYSSSNSGPTIAELHGVSENIRKLTSHNPLLKRGCELRGNYVFGNGIQYRDVKPGSQKIIDAQHNKRVLFSSQGYEELNRAKYTDGNLFVLLNRETKRFTRIPITQITSVMTDPDDDEDVWFVKRAWTSENKNKEVWIPTPSCPDKLKNRGTIDRTPVQKGAVIFHESTNKQVGWTFGVPDAMSGVLWALAYSEYLNNNTKLVKAYARFAMRMSSPSAGGVNAVAGELRQRDANNVGATAITGGQNTLTAMPATGSQVNFNNGQPLAAMVAASLGVSVIALISSPGAAGGSYGAAATLDAPTLIGMGAIQDAWTMFYETLFTEIGSPNTKVEFPAIEKDPTYRTLNTVLGLVSDGILHREEGRDITIDLLDLRDPKKGLPELPDNPVSSPASTTGEQGITNNDGRTDLISK